MNDSSTGSSTVGRWVVLAALVLGVCSIISAHFVVQGYAKSKEQTLPASATLTGSAEKLVTADKVKWSIQFSRTSPTSSEQTVALLRQDEQSLREALKKANILDADISVQPMVFQPSSYESYASQVIVIEAKQVNELGSLADTLGPELFKQGTRLTTNSLDFFYSDLEGLQKSLTKDALADARAQAEDLFGNQVKQIQTVGSSQLQVTPEHSSPREYDYGYGNTATSSIKKKVKVTMVVDFRLK
jgi:hypothetical protein